LFKGKVDISPHAATLMSKKLELVGTEQNTVGDMMVHKIFLRSGVVILENLDLSQANVGNYLISAFPLKMEGCEGSPCRAVLIGE
jgi:arylformamidase